MKKILWILLLPGLWGVTPTWAGEGWEDEDWILIDLDSNPCLNNESLNSEGPFKEDEEEKNEDKTNELSKELWLDSLLSSVVSKLENKEKKQINQELIKNFLQKPSVAYAASGY
jgi:hypothetical protein